MGWSIGYDEHWERDIGYGVPAYCDHPGCTKEIDRGLAYVCGGEPYGGEHGCGLYFCDEHFGYGYTTSVRVQRCARCVNGQGPYDAKPDHPRWIAHQLTDPSWAQFRANNPAWVAKHSTPPDAGARRDG